MISVNGATVRPPARGDLLVPDRRQRACAPLAGGIGLSPEQAYALTRRWAGAQCLFSPGLILEHFATPFDTAECLVWLQAGQPERLSGAFALAWYTPEGALQLGADALGERTLFYARVGAGLIFASNLELLLVSGLVPRQLHLPALARYLSYAYLPGPETLISGVYRLQPGQWLRWQDGQLTSRNRWAPPAEDNRYTEATATEELRIRLEQATHARLPAGEPAMASLSGGVDSSLVVALLARFRPGTVQSWSISFGPGYRNELAFSQAVASACATRHRVLEIRPATVLHHLDQTLSLLGNPIGDPLTVPNALLFREAAREGAVLFNGEGGDPLFGGPKNIPMLLARLYLSEDPGEALARLYLHSYRKLYSDLDGLLLPAARPQPGALVAELQPWLDPAHELVQQLMRLNTCFKGTHHILYKVNALSAGLGILPASPLFDRQVAELALSLPPGFKLRGSEEKYLLKQAVADWLPPQILKRPKSGMQVPVEAWFKPGGPLHRAARVRLRRLARYPWFDNHWLAQLIRWELPGYLPRHGLKVWMLISLEAWLRHYLGPP